MCAVCSCVDTSYDTYFLEVVLEPVTHTIESRQVPADQLLYLIFRCIHNIAKVNICFVMSAHLFIFLPSISME